MFHALLVGVNKYQDSHFYQLPTSLQDIKAITAVLNDPSRCGYSKDKTQVLIGEQATTTNIETALLKLGATTNENSTVFIYYSGHGGHIGEGSDAEVLLCTTDTYICNLQKTALSGRKFSNMIASIPARKLIAILDVCHAAGSVELKSTKEIPDLKTGLIESYYEALSQGSGRVIIASSKADQFSYVRPQKDLSLFTYYLVQALDGKAIIRNDGLIHVLDVFDYISTQIRAYEPRQTPILKAKDLDANFPIAFAPKNAELPVSKSDILDLSTIRQKIIDAPLSGAKLLSEYMNQLFIEEKKRDELDLKVADLKRIEHDIEIFGPSENQRAERNRIILYLLELCTKMGLEKKYPSTSKSDFL